MEILCLSTLILLFFLYQLLKHILRLSKLDKLEEKPVVITGCDHGLGHDVALKLCGLNIPTIATCLTENGVDSLKQKSQLLPGYANFHSLRMDVTDEKNCVKVFETVNEIVGQKGLWAIIFNAGVIGLGLDDWLTPQDYSTVLDVNLIGTIRVCQLFRPLLLPMKGRLIFVTSMLGKFALPSLGPYSVSKFAAEAYADTVRRETFAFGITVHTVAPGLFATEMTKKDHVKSQVDRAWNGISKEKKEFYGAEYREQMKVSLSDSLSNMAVRGTSHVVDACVHAATAVYPSRRYILGTDAQFFSWLPYAPVMLQDKIVLFMAYLRSAPVPKYCVEAMQGKMDYMRRQRVKLQNETWRRLHLSDGQ